MSQSKDGKGRTVFEILTGRNKKDLTPLEFQYHNPLNCRIGNKVILTNYLGFSDINFSVKKIFVYETRIQSKKFYHTDYHLVGISMALKSDIQLRLRFIPDNSSVNDLGNKIQLLQIYHSMEWDESFYNNVLLSDSGKFDINQDDEGNDLPEPVSFWRVEDVLDAYHARVTVLEDKNNNGVVEDDEISHFDVSYWDYHRDAIISPNCKQREFLTIEINDKSRYFTFLRGQEIGASQITLI